MGGDSFQANSKYYIRITSGSIEAVSSGDTIDCNGNIFLEGGTLSISGPSMGMEGAVDCDGSFTITGGMMIAAGSSVTPSSDSTQSSLLVSYTAQQQEGSVLTLKDEGGNVVLEYTARKAFTMSAMTSPDLEIGKTYSLYAGGEKLTDITLSNTATAISDSGGAYTGGDRGGPGGGKGDRPGGWNGDGAMPERPPQDANRTPGATQ